MSHWLLLVLGYAITAASAFALVLWAGRLPERSKYTGRLNAYGAGMMVTILPLAAGLALMVKAVLDISATASTAQTFIVAFAALLDVFFLTGLTHSVKVKSDVVLTLIGMTVFVTALASLIYFVI